MVVFRFEKLQILIHMNIIDNLRDIRKAKCLVIKYWLRLEIIAWEQIIGSRLHKLIKILMHTNVEMNRVRLLYFVHIFNLLNFLIFIDKRLILSTGTFHDKARIFVTGDEFGCGIIWFLKSAWLMFFGLLLFFNLWKVWICNWWKLWGWLRWALI